MLKVINGSGEVIRVGCSYVGVVEFIRKSRKSYVTCV